MLALEKERRWSRFGKEKLKCVFVWFSAGFDPLFFLNSSGILHITFLH